MKVIVHRGGRTCQSWKTSIKRNTLTPVFNKALQFNVKGCDLSQLGITFVVMNYLSSGDDETVGVAHVGQGTETESGRSHWAEVVTSEDKAVSRWHTIVPLKQT